MRVLVYGGSFNPPHLGHVSALRSACAQLCPDRALVIPTALPPHKELAPDSPDGAARLELTCAAFADVPGAETSDLELRRGGASFTSDTLSELCELYPGEELFLLMGTDMYLSLPEWHEPESIMKTAKLAVALRENGDSGAAVFAEKLRRGYGAETVFIKHSPIEISSTEIRSMLPLRQGREYLPDGVYSLIIKNRLYGAKPDFGWLREKSEPYLTEKRVFHVRGCAQEARKLALRWGEDPDEAEEAGILHDITKKLLLDEQLLLCEKYDIINDTVEAGSTKLLHAKTGAALSRELFGIDDRIYGGIRWHTTGRAGMTLFEQIIYLADYIEPTRSFDGLEALRSAAYSDIRKAMIMGLQMGLDDLKARGETPHRRSVEALEYFLAGSGTQIRGGNI